MDGRLALIRRSCTSVNKNMFNVCSWESAFDELSTVSW
jgi:hypothetical protein